MSNSNAALNLRSLQNNNLLVTVIKFLLSCLRRNASKLKPTFTVTELTYITLTWLLNSFILNCLKR